MIKKKLEIVFILESHILSDLALVSNILNDEYVSLAIKFVYKKIKEL